MTNKTIDEKDILARLDRIEHQLKFFTDAYTHLHNFFIKGVHVKVEKTLLEPTYTNLLNKYNDFCDLHLKLKNIVKEESILGTLAFMAKRLHEMNTSIINIAENGINKNIKLNFTMDGHELIKKNEDEIKITKTKRGRKPLLPKGKK